MLKSHAGSKILPFIFFLNTSSALNTPSTRSMNDLYSKNFDAQDSTFDFQAKIIFAGNDGTKVNKHVNNVESIVAGIRYTACSYLFTT